MRSSESILTAGKKKNICAFGGACAASGCCARGIGPCPASGAIGAPTAAGCGSCYCCGIGCAAAPWPSCWPGSGLAFMKSRTCGRAKIISVSNCSNSSKSAWSAAIRCSPKSLEFVSSNDSDFGDKIWVLCSLYSGYDDVIVIWLSENGLFMCVFFREIVFRSCLISGLSWNWKNTSGSLSLSDFFLLVLALKIFD